MATTDEGRRERLIRGWLPRTATQEGLLWAREYEVLHSIPGSLRRTPARVLIDLWRTLPTGTRRGPVLDAGCGAGRNSLYLAQEGCAIEAVDSCEAALAILRDRMRSFPAGERVAVRRLSLDEPLPYDASSFAVALDIYVSCHFLQTDRLKRYWTELRRVLRPNGYALAAFFSTDDEYYQQLLDHNQTADGIVVTDSINEISKRLFTAEELRTTFKPLFPEVDVREVCFEDNVQGKRYLRRILGVRMRKARQ